MHLQPVLKIQMRLLRWSRYLIGTIIIISCLLFIGWFADIDFLRRPSFGVTLFALGIVIIAVLAIYYNILLLNKRNIQKNEIELTERKLQLEERLNNEKKIHEALVIMGDNVWEFDFKTTLTRNAETFFQLWGYPPDHSAVFDSIWWRSMHPEDRHLLEENDRKYKAGLISSHQLEYRIYHKDGSLKWILDRGVLIDKDENGKPLKLIGTHTDITEKKNSEHKIKQSNERFELIGKATSDAIWEFDPVTKQAWGNEMHQRLYGLSLTDTVPTHEMWVQKLHPDEREKTVEDLQHTLDSDKNVWIAEYRFQMPDEKNYYTIYDCTYIVRNDEGKPVRLMGCMMDLTDLKKTEQKLTESEKNLRHVLSSSSDMFYVIDTNYTITLINQTAAYNLEKAWGKAVNIGTCIFELFPDESEEPVRASFRKVFSGEKVEYELFILHEELAPWWLVSYMPVRDDNGLITGAYVTTKDISKRKIAEEKLRRSNERFEMIASTTHDAIWEWNLETNELWGNEMHQQLYGLTIADPVPLVNEWIKRIHPEDRERTVNDQKKALASDKNAWISEYKFKTQKGYQDIYDRCYIVRDASGKAIRMMGSMMDITARKKAEEAIRQSEERYRILVENAPEVLVVLDINTGKFTSVSESAVSFFKMTKEDLLNTGPVQLSPLYQPDGSASADAAMAKLNEAVHGGKPVFEWTHCDSEGNLISTEVRLVRLPSETQVLIRGSIHDITDRKKAEEELRMSEKRYRDLIEQASDPIMITDQQGNFLDVNSALCELFGYKKEELLQSNVRSLIDAEHLKQSPMQFDRLINGEHVFSQRRMVHKDGTIIEVEANIKMIPDGRILAIARNITERKKVEDAIRVSEETRRLIMNSALDAIITMDVNGFVTGWNAQAEKIFGWTKDEIIGQTLYDTIIPHRYREQHKKGLERFARSGKGTVLNKLIEITALDRYGKEFPVELSIVPIRQGENEFFCGFLRDITERKTAEEKIKKEKELSDSIINSLPGVFYLYDESGKFLRWNKNFEAVSGYDASEMSELHPLDFFDSDEKELLKNKIEEVFEKGMEEVEAHFFTKEKKRIPYYFNGWRVTFEGKPCLIGVGIDISDRKQADEKLKQSYQDIRRLASHLEQIREEERIHIAREIHDELGQQLTVLKMDISWLNKKMDKKNVAIQQKMSELLGVIDNTVKTVRRISTELRPSLLDDLGLIAALDWQCQEFARRSGIETSFSSNTDHLKLTQVMATGLFRIFQESLTNIARHADATEIHARVKATTETLLLIIQDNGKGFLATGIENKKTLGILGMRERVSLMGGEFKIISTPGEGTEISVSVPVSSAT